MICSSCGHYASDHTDGGCGKVTGFGPCPCKRSADSPPPTPRVAHPQPCARGMSVFTCQVLDRCDGAADGSGEWCWRLEP